MINRRQFLTITGAGASALVTGGITSLVEAAGAGATTKSAANFNPDLDIALKATAAESSILPGNPTRVWSYRAQLLKGDPKDTVLLMPGERVELLVRFGDYAGLFLYHCHNLEHEDMGMMRNFLVEGTSAAA
jgi:FtsP/CotA-like multicopper oxidase with cupredoxin domain